MFCYTKRCRLNNMLCGMPQTMRQAQVNGSEGYFSEALRQDPLTTEYMCLLH